MNEHMSQRSNAKTQTSIFVPRSATRKPANSHSWQMPFVLVRRRVVRTMRCSYAGVWWILGVFVLASAIETGSIVMGVVGVAAIGVLTYCDRTK